MKHGVFVPLFCIGITIAGCGKVEKYQGISLSDSRLAEFRDLLLVDRPSLGIPALPSSANISVERSNGTSYDVMLHIYSRHEQRTIAFRQKNGILKWIHEQVTVEGPRTHDTVDGTLQEQIVLTYETKSPDRIVISYSGPDTTLNAKTELQQDDVQPLIDDWLKRP